MTLIIAKIIYYTLLAICAFPIFVIVILIIGWAIAEDEKTNGTKYYYSSFTDSNNSH